MYHNYSDMSASSAGNSEIMDPHTHNGEDAKLGDFGENYCPGSNIMPRCGCHPDCILDSFEGIFFTYLLELLGKIYPHF